MSSPGAEPGEPGGQHTSQRRRSVGVPPALKVLPEWLQTSDYNNNQGSTPIAVSQFTAPVLDVLAQWQTSLRTEAQQRLGGFQPPLQIASGLGGEDWGLLARAGSKQHTPPLLQFGSSFGMKRSASENSLDSMSSSQGSRKFNRQQQWGWEGPHDSTGMFGYPMSPVHAQAHANAMQAMGMRPPYRIAQDSQEQADVSGRSSPHAAGMDMGITQYSLGPHLAPGSLYPGHSAWAERLGSPQGISRVPTAPSLLELGETLNSSASRNFQAVKAALQNAQASIQETASNCQQNLATLTTIFQQNLQGSGGPLQAALSNSKAMVTWSITNANDPLGGALVPWQVLPQYLRARDMEASGALTAGSGEGASTSGRTQSAAGDWVTPLDQYMSQLDATSAKQRRRKQAGSIRDQGRQVAIVTTASLPWMTGTSVNPLLRAAYLACDETRKVTLVLPWLSPADQRRVFPHDMMFETPEQQEEYVRDWARRRTGLDCNFKVKFYPSRYAAEKGSILPVGDITAVIPDHEADVAVLEEPEHLNWYHHGTRWTDKFNHVVGVMHTNYLDYARREENGHVKELILKHINAWVCRIHCHKVVKLSDAVQPLPREDTMFVHGVSPAFLKVGQAKAQAAAEGQQPFARGAYFLGKVLWAKGYTELLDRLNEHAERTGNVVDVDVFGSGPDLKAVEEEAHKRHLPLHFNGAKDHADAALQDYQVFINPSLSDVVATTTAEALAMGKWVVCADHASNAFFSSFPNCLIYRNSEEFSTCLQQALSESPRPLSAQDLHRLTWEAATDRFLDVADLGPQHKTQPLEASVDKLLFSMHNTLTGIEFMRVLVGAGARTRDLPARITDYVPDENDVGGFFDKHSRVKDSWKGKAQAAPASGSASTATSERPVAVARA